ncbi:hypothetical protein BDY19DRAFT_596216 [Irpex rosettiformis]|uniref:Uncharacterized protein n=1 Tax=Irpex rosettiformis TaxID=378272 RepID=A0ACB8UFA2_9APHY|nr:hypothetical protein BDY19DRAFT_596216 [Irpex rosettiformis]
MEDAIAQFCGITGAGARDARKYLEKYGRRVDMAIDAFYNDPAAVRPSHSSGPSTSRLNQLFDTYKDPDGDDITVDGTIKMCEDLAVDPEDVVLLAVAYELRSPRMGEWNRKGWTEGWKRVGIGRALLPTSVQLCFRVLPTLGPTESRFGYGSGSVGLAHPAWSARWSIISQAR